MKLTLSEGGFYEYETIPSVVYPRLMQPQML